MKAAQAQVEEQHSYLVRLKETRADRELYQQEKLVERQLRKRRVGPLYIHVMFK